MSDGPAQEAITAPSPRIGGIARLIIYDPNAVPTDPKAEAAFFCRLMRPTDEVVFFAPDNCRDEDPSG